MLLWCLLVEFTPSYIFLLDEAIHLPITSLCLYMGFIVTLDKFHLDG